MTNPRITGAPLAAASDSRWQVPTLCGRHMPVTEARDLESREQSGEYIYRVRGAPGDMKTVKIKKRT